MLTRDEKPCIIVQVVSEQHNVLQRQRQDIRCSGREKRTKKVLDKLE